MWVHATRAVDSQRGVVDYVQTLHIERVWTHGDNTVVAFVSGAVISYIEPVEHFIDVEGVQ